MLFNSQHFLWFFVLVWAGYWAQARWRRVQNVLLLLASYFFYGYWDVRFLALIVVSTIVDYVCGLELEREDASDKRRRSVLLVSLVLNLGLLGVFKYYNFFVDSASELLAAMGLHTSDWTLRIVLPVGISFYTFQTLSYTIDRYRRQIPVERSLLNFALYVSFFPQLVAGPIVRAVDFLPQAAEPRVFRWTDQAVGVRLVLWGLFKKSVVADNLAPFVDGVFAAHSAPGMLVRLLAVYAFAVQIYCDFSGYTDIARGTAQMLGFRFPWNFRMPYFATNPSEFWRRWHMTLSTWLRDYLYIPLGGNRRGPGRTLVNLMLTMVLGGLWHGAAWTFVLWGVYQGILLVVHRLWRGDRGRAPERSPLRRVLVTAAFFQLVCLGWLFFRAQSFSQILSFLTPTRDLFSGLVLSDVIASGLVIGVLGTAAVFVWDVCLWKRGDAETPLVHLGPAAQAALCLALYVSVTFLGRFLGNEFIYFQF